MTQPGTRHADPAQVQAERRVMDLQAALDSAMHRGDTVRAMRLATQLRKAQNRAQLRGL